MNERADFSEALSPAGGVGQPHDGLFRLVIGHPVHGASVLRLLMPPQALGSVDVDQLRLMPGSFVDEELRQWRTDVLFAAPTASSDDVETFVYFLMEHQSDQPHWMAYRLLEYQVRIWAQYRRDHPQSKQLPPIIPVVIYQGQREWKAPADIAELFHPEQAEVARAVGVWPTVKYVVHQLRDSELSPGQISC